MSKQQTVGLDEMISQAVARALAFQHAAPAATAPAFLTTPAKAVGGGNGKVAAVTSRSFSVVPAEFHGVKGYSIEKAINGTVAKRKFVTVDEASALVAALKR